MSGRIQLIRGNQMRRQTNSNRFFTINKSARKKKRSRATRANFRNQKRRDNRGAHTEIDFWVAQFGLFVGERKITRDHKTAPTTNSGALNFCNNGNGKFAKRQANTRQSVQHETHFLCVM